MDAKDIQKLRELTSFEDLVIYLRDELDWPIDIKDAEDLDRVTFNYSTEELGIDPKHAVKIETIKQIRPLAEGQPWGVFYIEFESKRLPVVVLRRILRSLVPSARRADVDRKTWAMDDLLFISHQGDPHKRSISFAHFRQPQDGGLPVLHTFSWDSHETHFYYIQNLNLNSLRWPEDETDADAWQEQWSKSFTVKHKYVITKSKELAIEMAKMAAIIRDLVLEVYNLESAGGPLHQLHLSFKMVLIHDLSVEDFADMYAQTVAYGLFSARATQSGDFAIQDVAAMIPNTNPFLKELLEELTTQEAVDLDELGVGQLVQLLREVNIEAILQDFGKQMKGEDPVVHFYETFLKEYDAEKKVRRGVFYTPDPVVSFIVRSVDHILRTEFDCSDGLADTGTMEWKGQMVPKVQILDPATGTGTFLKYVIQTVWDTFYKKHKKISAEKLREKWNQYVPKHLLPRLYGFELMMAPYAVAHMKLGLTLQQTGYDFGSGERVRVYLTNTLQPAHEVSRTDTPSLAHEAEQANAVKLERPITIVIGNPPYANFGMMNKGPWILDLLKDFKTGLHEKKINIDDDFIKFLRYAQWQIDQTGFGILAFITNNTYIDGITHRRMRESLMETFDEIYIYDLHGSSMKSEKPPKGITDQNVFDIKQGVSIAIMIKKEIKSEKTKIFHADLWGSLSKKYDELILNNTYQVEWQLVNPSCPYYFFVQKDFSFEQEYQSAYSIRSIFKISQNGIKTDRDSLFVDYDKSVLEHRIRLFYSQEGKSQKFRDTYRILASSSYDIETRRDNTTFSPKKLEQCLYRPFDSRILYYDPKLTSRPAYNVMKHMLAGRNISLLSCRQQADIGFQHAYCSSQISECCSVSLKTKEITSVFPLYLYSETDSTTGESDLFGLYKMSPMEDLIIRKPNLSSKFVEELADNLNVTFVQNGMGDLKTTFGPEDIFYYIYAILYSSNYRDRYAEFLKIDFPRVPLTSNLDLFHSLGALGADLVAIHLLEDDYAAASWNRHGGSIPLKYPITNFVEGRNGNSMGSFSKSKCYQEGRVYIDTSIDERSSYFEDVPEDVWNFHVGGYQVLYKWLYDRRGKKGQPGRTLTPEDIEHYQRIVVALKETIRLMGEIDEVIEEYGGWPIK